MKKIIIALLLVSVFFGSNLDPRVKRIYDLRYPTEQKQIQKCITIELLKAFEEIKNAPENVQEQAKEAMARPTGLPNTLDTPGGNFKIHYTTTGTNRAPLDYINRLSEILDEVWEYEINYLGYTPPPSAGTNGGDSRYDVYVRNLAYYYGSTMPEDPGPASWNDYTSYIEIENDMSGFPATDDPEGSPWGQLKVTAAHEFYHAIQMGYRQSSELWLYEVTAVWMEDMVYDYCNDYLSYVDGYYDSPWEGLTLDDFHAYESCVFGFYLAERFGVDIWKTVFTNSRTNSRFTSCVNVAVSEYGMDLEDCYADFAYWNWFTSSRANPDLYYLESSRWPTVTLERTVRTYPYEGTTTHAPQFLASNYIVFDNITTTQPALTISFTGATSGRYRLRTLVFRTDGSYDIISTTVPSTGTESVTVSNLSNVSKVVFIPSSVRARLPRL